MPRAGARSNLEATRRQTERAVEAFRQTQRLQVIPYLFPWYELLLSGKLTIKAANGEFLAVKTGLWPRKHRGWTLFYHSKSRIADMVAARHKLNPRDYTLGVLVGVGWLEDSRVMTPEERYALALKFNAYSEGKYRKYWKDRKIDVRNFDVETKLEFEPSDWVAKPYPVGNFYLPATLKKFKNPIPIKYPSGAVTGTHLIVTPDIQRALKEVGVEP